MSLTEYHRKRHFNRTPEPAAVHAGTAGRSFVVQKHQASHLHYDFRLELDGVLKSWAMPKGPSLDPKVKRLAMHVEDHPVAYGSFEGIIPKGEYGGGTVMLWDRGTWEPIGDPAEGYRSGRLKFALHGEKLHGRWMLLRTGKRASARAERQWLLFKERDTSTRSVEQGDILEGMPLSVATGRSLEEIAAARDGVWQSKAKSEHAAKAGAARTFAGAAKSPDGLGSKVAALPDHTDVQLATLVQEAPVGDDWLHEIKFDGYRMLCRIADRSVTFISRNHQDWTKRMSSLVSAARQLPVRQAILDGEVVVLRADGSTDFQELQNAFRDGRADRLHYFVFDLLHLDGQSLTGVPLTERKRLLTGLLASDSSSPIRPSEHVIGSGPAFFEQACKLGLEGIVSKRCDRPYRAGRSADWLKVKCSKQEEFVIGGYSEPTGSRSGFGALLVGQHDAAGKLIYAGKVGTGFDERTLRSLFAQLQSLERDESPFSNLQSAGRKTHWVVPQLVAQVSYGNRTRDGLLRHASFHGLREDKAARAITGERAVPLAQVVPTPLRAQHLRTLQMRQRKARGGNASEYDAIHQQFAGVRFTSPDKMLYPEDAITKLELARYYQQVEPWILPHLVERPVVLVRCPEGRTKECFYQRHPAVGTPDALRRIPIQEKDQTADYVLIDDVEGLISLAQIGALEIHAWGACADRLDHPDRLIFDLDPDRSVSWSRVVQSARQVRTFLQELGLESFVKTTGGKGLHLVVPIERRHDWAAAKTFCKRVAEAIVAADPTHYTANMAKAARHGKIFIDYLRNGRGATAVVPYSPRARPGAPVSVPLTWKELSARIDSAHYTICNLGKRLASLRSDPWAALPFIRQGLARPLKKLEAVFVPKSVPTSIKR